MEVYDYVLIRIRGGEGALNEGPYSGKSSEPEVHLRFPQMAICAFRLVGVPKLRNVQEC